MKVPGLRSDYVKVGGIVFFGRMLDKIRLKAAGQLPPAYFTGTVGGLMTSLNVPVKNAKGEELKDGTWEKTEEYGRLVVTVSDDGAGATRGSAPRDGFGIGLGNVHDRLAARFGEEASVVSGPTANGYATEIRIPLIGEARHAA